MQDNTSKNHTIQQTPPAPNTATQSSAINENLPQKERWCGTYQDSSIPYSDDICNPPHRSKQTRIQKAPDPFAPVPRQLPIPKNKSPGGLKRLIVFIWLEERTNCQGIERAKGNEKKEQPPIEQSRGSSLGGRLAALDFEGRSAGFGRGSAVNIHGRMGRGQLEGKEVGMGELWWRELAHKAGGWEKGQRWDTGQFRGRSFRGRCRLQTRAAAYTVIGQMARAPIQGATRELGLVGE